MTHASSWELEGHSKRTDAAHYWNRKMAPELMADRSPNTYVQNIVSPMLVIHGDKDYRVTVGEGFRLWSDLLSESPDATDSEGKTVHRFLYFPDEGHWILKPQHARVWYSTVEAFLAEHVLGTESEFLEKLGL
ncbi:dipeptidyl aminopeptidases/acylaminoacyl-peptidase [Renibacterium salmoninarum ATCC 33209]|uniref:Dipeptidyl aminopeptidases/acylaminoacyl-peptidase n=1 Tax=Renibacterium salmoninarum (strain ATCC 33209 / DSM 20767 / JCM 11484 / NBRC 15589 / NCIMB 2235) TaxID=288705 RepID=A9WT25_RENSM|nr:prolyl oligopeptidase family serine peptidase [Renibacterium salmoninarum]ABY23963.1 dipeptidyl aminopeptidases/acylaminoacyl-peptidase [Renibacterium salmoninarum ATCC 33209]